VSVVFTGCASIGFKGREDIHGLVVDGKNKPAAGYQIAVGTTKALANETGLFTLENVRSGTYHLKGRGTGYLSLEKDVKITNKKDLLYIKVVSVEEIIEETEAFFKSGDWAQAEKTAAKAVFDKTQTDSGLNSMLRFYYAVALYKQQRINETNKILRRINSRFTPARDFKNKIKEEAKK
jgi:hypothetical protein